MLEYAVSVEPNPRNRPYMEDRHVTLDLGHGRYFFGVYDGHGGHEAAELAKEKLHLLFLEELRKSGSVKEAFTNSYKAMDEEIKSVTGSGTTATTVYFENGTLYLANVGDSNFLLLGKGCDIKFRSHSVHYFNSELYDSEVKKRKPDPRARQELDRIWNAGGKYDFRHVFYERRGLAMTRSLGDSPFQKILSCEPECYEQKLNKDFDLIMASDGLWEFVEKDNVERICKEGKKGSILDLSDSLVKAAIDSGSNDNITVMAIRKASKL